MTKPTIPILCAIALVTSACSAGGGDDGEGSEQQTAEYACLHVAEGTIVDVSGERESARTITLGREPYRVNLLPDVPGFLRIDAGTATDVVVLVDQVGMFAALWRGDDREALEPGEPNPFCEQDITEMHEVSLASGTNWLELGPVYQANVWMMIATP